MKDLVQKIESGRAIVGVVGLGYVGLPLSVLFAKKFRVYGFDTNPELIRELKDGKSHVEDLPNSLLASILNKSFFPTLDECSLSQCDFIIISVPTPLTESKEPDLRCVKEASHIIAKNLRRGQFVILESTTYPGTTETVVVPILESSGLKAGRDFGVAYSPERLDPGNREFTIENIPKVVGGLNEESTTIACKLFESVVDKVIVVSNCQTAEATKMLENIFRVVNIAMINEIAMIFERMEIDTWEVVEAASSKPFGFMPFYPGPGVGGHCIPLDPFYMSYRAKQFGIIARSIQLSGEINEFMRFHVVNLLVEALSKRGRTLKDSTVAVFGLAYKRDIADTRESPAKKIIEEILLGGGAVRVYDPLAKRLETELGIFESEETMGAALRGAHAVLLLTDQTDFQSICDEKFLRFMDGIPVIVDTCNVLKKVPHGTIYVGLGKCGGT